MRKQNLNRNHRISSLNILGAVFNLKKIIVEIWRVSVRVSKNRFNVSEVIFHKL